jgi:hypothetical protein
MQIARLSLSGVNEKMRFAAHTVWGNLRPTDSSHLHCLDVAFGPPAIAKASVRKSAQKQKPLKCALVQSRKIAPQKPRKIISQITLNKFGLA